MAAVDVDFDLLVKRVESTIVEDELRYRSGFTPQELLVRSNTAMFAPENAVHNRDLTNPRDLYNLLSNRSKSIEDLTQKFKRGLVKSFQTTGSLQNLTRGTSLNDIYNRSDKEFMNKPLQPNKHYETKYAKKHTSKIRDVHSKVTVDESEEVSKLSLPRICQENKVKAEKELGRVKHKGVNTQLPSLKDNNTREHKEIESTHVRSSNIEDCLIEVKTQYTGPQADPKLDKWFSEMPNEVFERAKRALMEQHIRDKLQLSKDTNFIKSTFPNPNKGSIRNSKKRVHNTFLELRVDSFGKQLKAGSGDRMNKYKLQQKSVHQLKMREKSDLGQLQRNYREEAKPGLQYKSLSNLALGKPKTKADTMNQKPRQKSNHAQKDNNYKVLYINDKVDVESRDRNRISNYEDYTERIAFMHRLHQQADLLGLLRHLGSSELNYCDDRTFPLIRENTKASIVNLALDKDMPKPRNPKHIEKSIKEAIICDMTLKEDSIDSSPPQDAGKDTDKENDEMKNIKHNPIITKIPTAYSSRTSESKSTTSSVLSKTNMEALKKFNTLEVFAEKGIVQDHETSKNHSKHSRHDLSTQRVTSFHFPVKFDAKHQQRSSVAQAIPEMFPLHETRRQEPDVVFRFEPGEVVVEHRRPRQNNMYNRPSDRAKLIYGKYPHVLRDNRVNSDLFLKTDDFKDCHSLATLSTKLEVYHEELGRFESRALDGSVTSVSSQHEKRSQNAMLMIKSHTFHETSTRLKNLAESKKTYVKQKRSRDTPKCDVATETEESGAQPALIEGTDTKTPASNQSVISSMSDHSGCTVSDFIAENNDGESLESDIQDDLLSPIFRIRSSQSV